MLYYISIVFLQQEDDFIPRNPPPPLTQHTAAKRPAAPTHECIGPATEEKGRVSGTATGQPKPI